MDAQVDRGQQTVAVLRHRGDCGPWGNRVREEVAIEEGNEIAVTVDQSPPFQRDQVGRNYVGLVVSWPVIVFSLVPAEQGRCIGTLAYGADTWGAKVTVLVNIAGYPRLKTAHDAFTAERNKDKRLMHGWIEGTIVKCGLGGMEIEPTSLEFFD